MLDSSVPSDYTVSLDSRPVLLTGGAGFLGRAIANHLVTLGRRAILLDVRKPDRPVPQGCEVVVGDVRDAEVMESQVARASAVVHLAAVVGIDRYLSDPELVIDVGVGGSRNVIAACVRHDCPLVLASSSEIYGMNCAVLREDSPSVLGNPATARWSYAVSKSAAEHLAFAAAPRGLRFVITRYFNVYGPLLDRPGEGRVVSKFLGFIRDGLPLPLVGGGEAVRSFCYVDDAVAATLKLLVALEQRRVASRAFNVGRHEPMTIRELAEEMVRLSGHGAGVRAVAGADEFGDGFEEIPRRVPDVSAIRDAIGFEAEVGLTAGLSRTLSHWGLLREGAPPRPPRPLPFARPHFDPSPELMATLQGCLASGRVTNDGPLVARFEREAAAFLGVKRVVAVSSGSAALQLVARSLSRRGKVVLPSFTFIATLSAFEAEGFEPLFCDMDPTAFTLDPGNVARLVAREHDIAAIVAVNVFGVTPPLAAIRRLADEVGAALILDGAHGFGAESSGRRVPTEPEAVTYSLHATKLLSTVEGGLVTSSDGERLDEIARLRSHGLARDPLESTPGLNARLDELRAAIGSHGLAGLDAALTRRREYAARLLASLETHAPGRWVAQRIPSGAASNFQNLALLAPVANGKELDEIIADVRRRGIEARRYFHPPLHRLRRFAGRFDLPVTDAICDRLLCIPIYSRMSDAELARIVESLARAGETGTSLAP